MKSKFADTVCYCGNGNINRAGADTAMIIFSGSGTIKVKHCDTENGEYSDFETIGTFESKTHKAVFVDIAGSKKFITVDGADVFQIILGDISFDPCTVDVKGEIAPPLKYNLYAWAVDSVEDSFGYSEKATVEVGDVLLLPITTGTGPIEDTDELTQLFEVTSVDVDGTIYAKKGDDSPIHFSRSAENDYSENVTEINGVTDIAENGLLVNQKGNVYKALNIAVVSEGE